MQLAFKGLRSIVYGHCVHSLSEPRIDVITNKWFDNKPVVCYGIDTGCCFGGSLTAMMVNAYGHPFTYDHDKVEFAQVQAKQVYFKGYHNE